MAQLLPIPFISNTVITYIPKLKLRVYWLFGIILISITVLIFSLPHIYIDISIKATGITRPSSERTEVKSTMSGLIQTVNFSEGKKVKAGDILVKIKDPNTQSKKSFIQYELNQREEFIRDLVLLTTSNSLSEETLSKLQSPLYKEQLSRYIYQKEQQNSTLQKAEKEVEINTALAKEKVISPKEFFDFKNNLQRIQSTYKAFIREQLINWQQDLVKYKLEQSQYQQQYQQLTADAQYFEVKAPISGYIQGINTKYSGGMLQVGESVCTISPEGTLVGECYVQTKDIGLLKIGQSARYQIEAFDYNYFGILTGKITAIDNDFTMLNNTPVIKIRCKFDNTKLHLNNGYIGQLKKGLNFQARFIVARRSLWQLLYDNLNNWLSPIAPQKYSIIK